MGEACHESVLNPWHYTASPPLLQATLAKPPPPVKSMMKALYVAYVVVISTYYSGGCGLGTGRPCADHPLHLETGFVLLVSS